MTLAEQSLTLHEARQGKLEICSKSPVNSKEDLMLATVVSEAVKAKIKKEESTL